MTDVLACMAEQCGVRVNYRYRELIAPQEEDIMTGDEVALKIKKKLGLKGKTDGNRLHEVESEFIA